MSRYSSFILIIVIAFTGCSNLHFVNSIKNAQKKHGIDANYLNSKSKLMLTVLRNRKGNTIKIDKNSIFFLLELYSAESGEIITRMWNKDNEICYIGTNRNNYKVYINSDSLLSKKELRLCEAFETLDSLNTFKVKSELENVLGGYGYLLTKINGYKVEAVY